MKNSYDYDALPDPVFSKFISDYFGEYETEKRKCLRQYTKVIDHLLFLRLQKIHWKYHYHLGIMQDIWKGSVTQQMAKDYSICQTYGASRRAIEKYLTKIRQYEDDAIEVLDDFEDQKFPNHEDGDINEEYYIIKI